MQVNGKTTIKAPRDKVWAALTDMDFVAACAPGLENMEVVETDRKFRATGSVGLGNLKVSFTGEIEFTALEAPDRAVLKGRGTAPGSAVEGTAEMRLSDDPEGGTLLDWTADINVLGTIASLASRMMGSVTQKLTAEFFGCVKQRIES
ncbi:MAG: carbon monoxide dehydrogenase subunit G [Anaerolineales bacterium]|nr:carbon monoxide dehydrogenase subunit G [Anaerolineales bacterium]MCW5856271.1 carbon monoxide dehydrogenase subunit G [Anaerolineales bacterium]